MSSDSALTYYLYLKQRSLFGQIYRQFYLYPFLTRYLRGKIIDIGCGIGDFLKYHKNAVGVDPNPYVVDHCRKSGLNASQILDSKLDFPDSTFDGAILDNVLEHVEQPGGLLNEIHRVLRPGSPLVVGVPGKMGFQADPDHKRFYDETSLMATLNQHGFDTTNILHMPFKCSWLDEHARQYCLYGVFTKA